MGQIHPAMCGDRYFFGCSTAARTIVPVAGVADADPDRVVLALRPSPWVVRLYMYIPSTVRIWPVVSAELTLSATTLVSSMISLPAPWTVLM